MIQGDNWQVHIGSNLDVLPTLPDNSVDSIVTDPPYELGFMGKKWDSSGIAYSTELWKECLRVLKPGGHLLSFGGTRTWHRVAVAIEDSGFEVRDSIAWMYGSGFPKSLDISKAIQKASGVEPIGFKVNESGGFYGENTGWNATPRQLFMPEPEGEAQQWEGWGTALKPAFEPIVVARKPLIGTVAQNVLTHGTGGLNIDGSRILPTGENMSRPNSFDKAHQGWQRPWMQDEEKLKEHYERRKVSEEKSESLGRWPANVILDPYTAELLDEQSGERGGGYGKRGDNPNSTSFGFVKGTMETVGYGDSGGASRFFYVAKASKRDRNEGLEELEAR